MASTKITQAEADRLLHMLKHALTNEPISFPAQGKKEEFKVFGDSKQDIFVICIFRGKINRLKYNIGARIKKNGVILLELHINPSNVHINPDGEKIIGNHWHIYTEDYYRSQAFPAEQIESDQFYENTIAFLDRFHVIEHPDVIYQVEF